MTKVTHPALLEMENEKLRGLLREAQPYVTSRAVGPMATNHLLQRIRAALSQQAEPAPAQNVEVLGETCIDGGTCHHKCTTRCFRRECCTHFSDYTGPWAYDEPAQAQDGLLDGIELKADGEANFYWLMRGNRWVAKVQMNGEMLVERQEAILNAMLARPAQTAPQPEQLPYWEPCNPGCDPEFNGHRSRQCAELCPGARAALSTQGDKP